MDEEPEVSQGAKISDKIEYKIVSTIKMDSPEIQAKVKTQFVPAAAAVLKGAAAMALASFMAYWSNY